jgi:hypothetical protein
MASGPQSAAPANAGSTPMLDRECEPDRSLCALFTGSIGYRISPLDMAFDNLTIAGDWTATGLDSGARVGGDVGAPGNMRSHASQPGGHRWI